MKGDKTYCKANLEFARNQSLTALINSFEIIDAFAQPTLNPEDYEAYERIKQHLLQTYSESLTRQIQIQNGILPT